PSSPPISRNQTSTARLNAAHTLDSYVSDGLGVNDWPWKVGVLLFGATKILAKGAGVNASGSGFNCRLQ
ncbi:MAG: hypothetical protein AAFV88_19300, partial [Planctomycetota bacterium]